jgi:hypothetical protein
MKVLMVFDHPYGWYRPKTSTTSEVLRPRHCRNNPSTFAVGQQVDVMDLHTAEF